MPPRPLRSLLFAPGNRPRMVAKVGTFGADAVILDLEDAVPVDEKVATRATVREALETHAWPRAYVRVNALGQAASHAVAHGLDDIHAVACPGMTGILLPKAESAQDILQAAEALEAAERRLGLEIERFEIIPLLESARGVLDALSIIRAHARVQRVSFGAGDFSTDIGVEWSGDGLAYLHARSQVVLASRAAGREQPLDTVYADIHDLEGLRADAEVALRLGFGGKFTVYPAQVAVVNGVFTPAPEDVDRARRWVAAFDQAVQDGKASVTVDGKMLDYANVAHLRRVVDLADALAAPEATHGKPAAAPAR